MHRRAVLQSLLVGFGAIGFGRAMFACQQTPSPPARDTNKPPTSKTPPTDDDEFVPGEGDPVAGDTPNLPRAEWEARARQLENEQARLFRAQAFSADSPGVMAGKERSHVPSIERADEGDGVTRVVVTVQHTMGHALADAGADAGGDAGKDGDLDGGADGGDAAVDVADSAPPVRPPDHYVTTIYIRGEVDGVDTVVGLFEFAFLDMEPPSVKFVVPQGVTKVTAFEWCTLHGLWTSEPINTAAG